MYGDTNGYTWDDDGIAYPMGIMIRYQCEGGDCIFQKVISINHRKDK